MTNEINVVIDEDVSGIKTKLTARVLLNSVQRTAKTFPLTATPSEIALGLFTEGKREAYDRGNNRLGDLLMASASHVPGLHSQKKR